MISMPSSPARLEACMDAEGLRAAVRWASSVAPALPSAVDSGKGVGVEAAAAEACIVESLVDSAGSLKKRCFFPTCLTKSKRRVSLQVN